MQDRYGPPDHLRVRELPVPVPGPGEVLVRVAATSVNLSDWESLVGAPLYARDAGLRRPPPRVLGSDIAGWVARLRPGVTGLAARRTGDRRRGGRQPGARRRRRGRVGVARHRARAARRCPRHVGVLAVRGGPAAFGPVADLVVVGDLVLPVEVTDRREP